MLDIPPPTSNAARLRSIGRSAFADDLPLTLLQSVTRESNIPDALIPLGPALSMSDASHALAASPSSKLICLGAPQVSTQATRHGKRSRSSLIPALSEPFFHFKGDAQRLRTSAPATTMAFAQASASLGW